MQLKKLVILFISISLCLGSQATFIPLTVQEIDGSPSVSKVKNITFNGATLTDLLNGRVLVTVSSAATAAGSTGAIQFNNSNALAAAPELYWNDGLNSLNVQGTINGQDLITKGNIRTGDLLRIEGNSNMPVGSSGPGMELFQNAGTVFLQGYNRSIGSYIPLRMHASSYDQYIAATKITGVTATGFNVNGAITANTTTSGFGTPNIFDFKLNGTSKIGMHFSSNATGNAAVIGFGSTIYLGGDGVVLGYNPDPESGGQKFFAGYDGCYLMYGSPLGFGGLTNSNVSLRYNGTRLSVKLGDNSADASLTAGSMTASGASPSSTVLTAKAAASQTANIQEWQDSAGTVMGSVNNDGSMIITDALKLRRKPNNNYTGISFLNAAGTAYNQPIYYDHNSGTLTFTGALGFVNVNRILANTISGDGFDLQAAAGASLEIKQNNGYGARFTGRIANDPVLLIKSAASQAANLQEWQNNAGTALTVISNGGNLGIGTNSPARKLHISQAMRLEPLSGSQPASPAMGDLYMDGNTGTLCLYDGSAWVAVAGGTMTCN